MRARPLADPSTTAGTGTQETAELVAAARAGDRTSFGLLYERYARLVHGVLLASAQRDDVQDLLQDVFFRALRQLHTLREPAAFGSWLATLARNEARMHHRSTRPTEELTDQYAAAIPTPATLGTADVLRLVEEMSGEEIAKQTGLTHGTVRVYLHHGIRLLREQLGDAS